MYTIKYHKKTKKDKKKLQSAGLANNTKMLIEVIKNNPYKTPPPYEKLIGNLKNLVVMNKDGLKNLSGIKDLTGLALPILGLPKIYIPEEST